MLERKNFVDDKSKKIYDALVELNKTKDLCYLLEAHKESHIESDPIYQQMIDMQEFIRDGKKMVLYGLGRDVKSYIELEKDKKNEVGYLYIPFLSDIPWCALGDAKPDRFKEFVLGKKVLNMDECIALGEDVIFYIGSRDYYEEIKEALLAKGVKDNCIYQYKYLNTICYEENQYFDSFMESRKEGVVVDGGCYCCDVVEKFIHWNHPLGYERIVAFEPDASNHKNCIAAIENNGWENVEVIHAGLSDCSTTMYMMSNGDSSSRLCEDGTESIRVCCLDDLLAEERVTFRKTFGTNLRKIFLFA